MRAPKTKAGFSLTELLVSLLILGLISMAATSTLSVGQRVWKKAQAVPDATLAEAELNHLRQALALRIAGTDGNGGGVVGSATEFSFAGLSQTEDGIFEKARISLRVAEAGLEVLTKWEGSEKTMILKHVDAAGFDYLATGAAKGWVKDWPSTDPAPDLVRLGLTGSDRAEPDPLILKLP